MSFFRFFIIVIMAVAPYSLVAAQANAQDRGERISPAAHREFVKIAIHLISLVNKNRRHLDMAVVRVEYADRLLGEMKNVLADWSNRLEFRTGSDYEGREEGGRIELKVNKGRSCPDRDALRIRQDRALAEGMILVNGYWVGIDDLIGNLAEECYHRLHGTWFYYFNEEWESKLARYYVIRCLTYAGISTPSNLFPNAQRDIFNDPYYKENCGGYSRCYDNWFIQVIPEPE